MHSFLQNAISFALLYSGFVRTNIQALYVYTKIQPYIFPMLESRLLHVIGTEKPDYSEMITSSLVTDTVYISLLGLGDFGFLHCFKSRCYLHFRFFNTYNIFASELINRIEHAFA